jgi:hypothetical protein
MHDTMKNRYLILFCLLTAFCLSTSVTAVNFGKVDNLIEYIIKGQGEKFDKMRLAMKPKEIDPFKNEIEYVDNLKKVMFEPVDDYFEAYYRSFVSISVQPYKNNLGLICTGMKISFDSLKNMADNKIMTKLQLSDGVMIQGRGIVASIDKTGYPVSKKYRNTLTDMIFNAQYSDLLTTPTLEEYRAFIVDWPNSEKLPSVKQNYDDALFAESVKTKDHDQYLMDPVLPNETKKHLVPDDWSIYGDKQSEKNNFDQAAVFYNKAIQLGSKEGLFKLTVLKHEGKVKSDEDELPTFQKLAATGDVRAKEYTFNIQNRTLNLSIEGSLESLLSKKDRERIISLTLTGLINNADMKVLKDMATKNKLATIDLLGVNLKKLPDHVFQGCSVLTSLKLPSTLLSIGNEALADCANLTFIALPDTLEEIVADAFNNCTSLTQLKIPALMVRGLGYSTFCSGCKKLNQFTVAEGNRAYSSLDGVLYNMDKTTIIRYPCGKEASLFSFPNTIVEVGVGAFEGCTYLTSLTMTETVRILRNAAFKGCTALTNISIPSMVSEIGAYVFENCNRLNSINLPMFINEIGYSTFKNCTNLSNVVIPASVREIRSEAFSGCTSLITVSFGVDLKGLGDNSFSGCNGLKDIYNALATPQNIPSIFNGVNLASCKLHVPMGSKWVYQQFLNWKDFTNILEQ